MKKVKDKHKETARRQQHGEQCAIKKHQIWAVAIAIILLVSCSIGFESVRRTLCHMTNLKICIYVNPYAPAATNFSHPQIQ
jgi:hypothetical protein